MTTTEQETTGITQTVQRSLQDAGYGSYYQYAGPVVEALVNRETDLSAKLVDYAVDAGADETEVKAYLREIGMSVAEDEPEPDEDDESEEPGDGVADMLRRIDQRLDSLTDFARRNGYRG